MSRSFVKLFMLGMPGSGKSTIVQKIREHVQEERPDWNVYHLNDYNVLLQLYREQRHRFLPAVYGGFTIKDPTLYNEVLERLQEQAEEIKRWALPGEKQIVLIEFARENYQSAFRAFSTDFLRDASFLFLDVDIKTCRKRVSQRVHKLKDEKNEHDCFVPRGVFTRYTSNEDIRKYFRDTFRGEYQISEKGLKIITNDDIVQEALPEINDFVDDALEVQELVPSGR